MVPKTEKNGAILDFEIILSKTVNSLSVFVTSKRLVEAIITQNNIKPI